jgi:hypothetical protein
MIYAQSDSCQGTNPSADIRLRSIRCRVDRIANSALASSRLTIYNSAAPTNVVSDLMITVAVGALVLIPSLILLLLVFKAHRESKSVGADTTAV